MIILTIIQLVFSLSLGVPLCSCSQTTLTSMTLTAEEFIRLSKEQRAEQMAEDTKVRAQERAEDLAQINKMIESGVKAEVQRVLAPIQSKNEERFGHLESEMADLKDMLKSGPFKQPPTAQPCPPVGGPSSATPTQSAWPTLHTALTVSTPVTQHDDAIAATIIRARKIISLEPISKMRDVERQYRQYEGITSVDQAMHSAVMEYLEGELKCRREHVPKIVSVFPPANAQDYERLYVEFEDEVSASYVASFARVLRKRDHQVSIYVPRCFQSRFQALNAYAKSIRSAPGLAPGDVKTKIRYGRTDFILQTKTKNGRWIDAQIQPNTFPPLLPPGSPAQSAASPPPGRLRGSPPPPGQKRGAASPLERMTKSARTSDISDPDNVSTPCSPSPPSPTPGTPPYTPSLAAGPAPAPAAIICDSGIFGHTAVSSPKLSSNKDFTFDSRRLSLPHFTRQKNLN